MRHDVHFAALQAATRVAFGVVLLGGCGSAADRSEGGDEYAESEVNAAAPCEKGEDAGGQVDTTAPDASQADAAAKTCDEIIASGFPGVDPDEYVWSNEKVASAPEVEACCKAQLLATEGQMPYRFHCCTVVDQDQGVGIACTPWGPPVPPAMRARPALGVA